MGRERVERLLAQRDQQPGKRPAHDAPLPGEGQKHEGDHDRGCQNATDTEIGLAEDKLLNPKLPLSEDFGEAGELRRQ